MNTATPILRRGSVILSQSTKRKGIKERRLITQEDSPHQNIIIIDAEEGAEVEIHPIRTSESIFILNGIFEMIFPDSIQTMKAEDICYFPPDTEHGLRCVRGPGTFLIVWAPPLSAGKP